MYDRGGKGLGLGFFKTNRDNWRKSKRHENNAAEKVILSFLEVRSQSADKTIQLKD